MLGPPGPLNPALGISKHMLLSYSVLSPMTTIKTTAPPNSGERLLKT